MDSSTFSESQPSYRRLLIMVLGEAIAGMLLYAAFKLMPLGLQILVAVACWVIVVNENLTFPKNKSVGSLLSALTGVAVFSCGVAWGITSHEFWSRLMLVGTCLLAGLIFLDRRQEWFD
jgi:hypothetical protein